MITFDYLDKKIIKSLDSFTELTDVAVSYFDKEANLLWESQSDLKMCALCRAYEKEDDQCKKHLMYSGQIASQLGEPYIFLCEARLTLIAFPIIIENEYIGAYMGGPIILGKLKNNVVEYILNQTGSTKKQADILIQLSRAKIYEPKLVSAIANNFGNCILASTNTNVQYETIKNSFKTTQKISDFIQSNKANELSYPLETEGALIEAVTSGDVSSSMELTHKYLDAVTLCTIGDVGMIKLNVIQMFGMLFRKVKNDAAIFEDAKDRYDFQLNKINKATNISELSYIVFDLIEQITVLFETSLYMGDVEVIKKTVNYISRHYMEKISLKMVSDHLHISTSYLSTLFRKEVGKTFSDFVTQFRIRKSEEMLKETSMSVTEVALHSGFEDQSYFNKVFKKATGKTPRQFRTNHSN